MADKAFVTPKVLLWARKSANISIVDVSKHLKVSQEKVTSWETGSDQPSISQAQTLAKYYRRPFALFFLPDVPYEFQPLQDFRKNASELSPGFTFIVREIQQRQNWISDLYQESGESPLSFIGKFSVQSSIEDVANDIRKTININPPFYRTSNHVKEWTDKIEAKGIFVSRASFFTTKIKFDSDDVKGFAISNPYAPFIFINTDDWSAPQLFTLIHELTHLWIGESGISNESDFRLKLKHEIHKVEAFCNAVAASILMPESSMISLPKSTFNSSGEVFSVAKSWGVSTFAILVRAMLMNLISRDQYDHLKYQADVAYRAYLIREEAKREREKQKEKKGPSPYLLQINRNSRLFTQTVLEAFHSGIIQPTQASNLLNVKVNNFSKLEAQLNK